MQKRMKQGSKFALLMLGVVLANGSNSYADGFYTIIGPDGRPMIVPKKNVKQEVSPKKQVENVIPPKKVEQIEKSKPARLQSSEPVPVLNTVKDLISPQTKSLSLPSAEIQLSRTISTKDKEIEDHVLKPSVEHETATPVVTKMNPQLEDKPILQPKKIEKRPVQVAKQQKSSIVKETTDPSSLAPIQQVTAPSSFAKIDGVEYVNNEYLEDQEFNLDGKKRFYMMPDGSGRLETVERKKGVSRSVLDKLLNRSVQSAAPIVLADSYIRLSEQDLSLAFEDDRCFLKDYSKSIKTLALQKEVGVWPRKPLKEKFEYDLVKMDASIQYMQIDSYAISNEKPVYYWPLVVFLDEQGCIKEGASGFKSGETNATFLQHAAIHGVIKVPSDARYIMMTPLASAVDVSEHELSNQGQIKISAIQ
ncbi:putative pilus assembly protein FilE [Acinetobacter sp. NIPH 2699]|uniref:putative pilus assembly protein FilE n=1 Tax=Acinetobacter sp. NIPH 2699 TaxID=2923433 RepID=UPI001F4C4992|nr:putative pilus assembly protein FilE [Acinetobacter sp. NIPH 2699]MCH7337777.1 putative pilus assembly protein FilE [Acinetobacter sp. NIPH 2699]